jgi:hypothetical protein
MYVWYVRKHRYNNILGVFGNVWGAFGNVSERFGIVLDASRIVSERFGSSWSGLERLNAFRPL